MAIISFEDVYTAPHQFTRRTEAGYLLPRQIFWDELVRILHYREDEKQVGPEHAKVRGLRAEVKGRLERREVLDPVAVYEVYERYITGGHPDAGHMVGRKNLEMLLRHATTQPDRFSRLPNNEMQRGRLDWVLGAIGALGVEGGVTIAMLTPEKPNDVQFALYMARPLVETTQEAPEAAAAAS